MVEETGVCEEESDVMVVCSFYDVVVPYTASRFSNIFDSTFCSPIDVVPEREEGIGGKGDSRVGLEPCKLFFLCKFLYWGDEIIIPRRTKSATMILHSPKGVK